MNPLMFHFWKHPTHMIAFQKDTHYSSSLRCAT